MCDIERLKILTWISDWEEFGILTLFLEKENVYTYMHSTRVWLIQGRAR